VQLDNTKAGYFGRQIQVHELIRVSLVEPKPLPEEHNVTDTIEFDIGGKSTTAMVAMPGGSGPFPGVVVTFHRGGLDAFTAWIVDQLAKAGFAACAPNHFHQLPPGVSTDDRRQHMTDEQTALDLKAAADWLEAQAYVDGRRLALVGHCMGGRSTWVGLAAYPDLWRCGCIWYGGNGFNPLVGIRPAPLSKQRLALIACPVMGFFGNLDKNPSPADVARIDVLLTELGKAHTFYGYDGAGHGFMSLDPGKRHQQATDDSWSKAVAFLREHLQ